jgi:hypothetical protein
MRGATNHNGQSNWQGPQPVQRPDWQQVLARQSATTFWDFL